MNDYQDKSKEELAKELQKTKKRLQFVEDSVSDYRQQIEEELDQVKQEKESINNSMKMLLARISHHIRVPMNGIIGIIDLLRKTKLTPEQEEYLNIINNSGDNLLSIVNDILDYTVIETGDITIKNQPFQLHEEIRQIMEMLSVKTKGKGITFEHSIAGNVPKVIKSDPLRLRQILINLLDNAIKYTKEGSVKLSVEVKEQGDEQMQLLFRVTDTGSGMSREDADSLLSTLGGSMKGSFSPESYEVTPGLGLYICKNLIDMMKGELGINSEEGKGSEFWFTIKVTPSSPEVLKEELDVPVKERKDVEKNKLSILLVEDNLLNQKFTIATLKKEGHTIDLAENGHIGLDKFKENNYDIILMDVQLPIMDGIETTKKIREVEKEQGVEKPVKILAVTAYAMEADRLRCIESGMDDFLSKPYKPYQLVEMINKHGFTGD
ncbi:MAG: response regulator [Bacteroidales bacterium]|nr:response regulator [Bacteroidales bacterium]